MSEITRRSFLKTAAIAGSGLAFGANLVRAQEKKDEVLDIALIGFGAQGRVLFESIMKLPNLRFRAICDLRPQQRRYVRLWVKKTLKQDVVEYDVLVHARTYLFLQAFYFSPVRDISVELDKVCIVVGSKEFGFSHIPVAQGFVQIRH